MSTIKDETMSGMTAPSTEEIGDFLSQAISLSQDLLIDLLQQINDIESFSAARERAWNMHFSAITSDISQFVEITTLWTKVVTTKRKIELPFIKQSHIHLLFVMKAINQAQLKQDSLVLDDLIKYELKDNLTQWKIDLIPQMKRLLSA